MSVYPFTPWIGARAQLAFNLDGLVRTFGIGQRLRELSVNRNYEAIYQIGSRVMKAIPFGRFEVEWAVESVLSELSVINLLFDCAGDTCSRSDDPIVFDVNVWYASGGEANSNWTIPGAVVTSMTVNASAEGRSAGVSLDVRGIGKTVSVSNTAPSSITLPSKVYTFAGATLSVGTQVMRARSVSFTFNNSAERVYVIGDDKPVSVYLGQWEVTSEVVLPIYGDTISFINTLMQNADIATVTLSLAGYGVNDATPSDTITITASGIKKITRLRSPLTEIGMNTITLELRFDDVTISISQSAG